MTALVTASQTAHTRPCCKGLGHTFQPSKIRVRPTRKCARKPFPSHAHSQEPALGFGLVPEAPGFCSGSRLMLDTGSWTATLSPNKASSIGSSQWLVLPCLTQWAELGISEVTSEEWESDHSCKKFFKGVLRPNSKQWDAGHCQKLEVYLPVTIWAVVLGGQLSICLLFLQFLLTGVKSRSKDPCPSVKHSYRLYLTHGLNLDLASLNFRKV